MKFVPFEIAKKLKEKGFKEECLSYYTTEFTLYNNDITLTDDKYLCLSKIDYEEFLVSHNSIKYTNVNYVDAPTIDQVLEWLREEKKIHLAIDIKRERKVGENIKWGYWVVLLNTTSLCCVKHYDFESDSYDDAVIAGIEYVINNLI